MMAIYYRLMKDRINRLNKPVGGSDWHDGVSNPLQLLISSAEINSPRERLSGEFKGSITEAIQYIPN